MQKKYEKRDSILFYFNKSIWLNLGHTLTVQMIKLRENE